MHFYKIHNKAGFPAAIAKREGRPELLHTTQPSAATVALISPLAKGKKLGKEDAIHRFLQILGDSGGRQPALKVSANSNLSG